MRSQHPCPCLSQMVCVPSVSTTIAFGRLLHAPVLSWTHQPDLHRWLIPHWPLHSLPTGRSESRADELQPRPWAAPIASITLARRRRPALLQAGSGASQIDLMEARDRRASVTSNLRSPEPATATVSEATVCKTSVEHVPVLLPSKLELPIWSPAAGACSAPSASRTLAAAKYRSRESGVLVYLSA